MYENKKTKAAARLNTKAIAFCGVFVALTVTASQLAVPIPFTPIMLTMSLFMVLFCGVLGPFLGTVSILVFILLGAIGVPVFAGFVATAALISPTGGYIIGYIPAVIVAGLGFKYFTKPITIFLSLIVAVLSCHLCGTIYYSLYTSTSFLNSLLVCSVPFIPADLLKAAMVTAIGVRLVKPLKKYIGT